MKEKVFQYTDYRKFLQDYYLFEKNNSKKVTYRYLSDKVGFKSAGHFTKILNGSTNISIELALRFARYIKLTQRQSNYFQNMVLFNQAKLSVDKKAYFNSMLSFKEAKIQIVGIDQYELYDKWFYPVVREILAYHKFKGNYNKLATMVNPSISMQEAQKAISVLERLGLIEKGEDGIYSQVDQLIKSDPQLSSVAVSNFILSSLDLAKRAVDKFTRKERVLSATLVTVSDETMQEIIRRTREFRKEIQQLTERDQNPERSHMLMFEIFPVSKKNNHKNPNKKSD